MAQFPHSFTESPTLLTTGIRETNPNGLGTLVDKEYVVLAGLSRYFAGAISSMAAQQHIREYCPRDTSPRRFATQETTEQWLGKDGGRGVFLLARHLGEDGLRLAGYGWTGLQQNEEHVPSGQTTFALRIGQEDLGRGLAAPFSRAIIDGSAELYGAKDIWLETWGSNGRAVGSYEKAGFVRVVEKEAVRPTLVEGGGEVSDIRVYMTLPNDLLPPTV